jgi:hypothetical protein
MQWYGGQRSHRLLSLPAATSLPAISLPISLPPTKFTSCLVARFTGYLLAKFTGF